MRMDRPSLLTPRCGFWLLALVVLLLLLLLVVRSMGGGSGVRGRLGGQFWEEQGEEGMGAVAAS